MAALAVLQSAEGNVADTSRLGLPTRLFKHHVPGTDSLCYLYQYCCDGDNSSQHMP